MAEHGTHTPSRIALEFARYCPAWHCVKGRQVKSWNSLHPPMYWSRGHAPDTGVHAWHCGFATSTPVQRCVMIEPRGHSEALVHARQPASTVSNAVVPGHGSVEPR